MCRPIRADIASLEAIAPAFAGVDTVVHLAAAVGSRVPFEVLLRDNIAGAYNVFEAARRAGVGRVVYASIGNTSAKDRPSGSREFAVWCSQRDAARGIARAIDAPTNVRYDICFITSDNRWGYRDLAHSREVLGYVPQDHAEDHR